MEILIPAPDGFSFARTAISHGWSELPPFEIDLKNWTITRVIDLGEGRAATAVISPVDHGLKVTTPRKLPKSAARKVIRDVTHIFRLDDDMGGFYSITTGEPDFAWIARTGAGRLLRSPTVFEDLVKTICTTNCSWGLTVKMINGLVNSIGAETPDGRRAFPTPGVMASEGESFYRDEVRAGYRAPYLRELAGRVASGSLDVEAWLGSDLPTEELKREMKRVKGVGDYAAENLLKLVGRYEGLALDSWVRAKFARTHNKGRVADDKKIERYYGRFGKWRGLALWCDMTRDWIGEDGAVTF